MIDDGIVFLVQEILRHQINSHLITNQYEIPFVCVNLLAENLTFNLMLALCGVGLKN